MGRCRCRGVVTPFLQARGLSISLALPSYILPLNLDFASVLGLAIRYISQMSPVNFLLANQQTEGVADNDDVNVVR